MSPSPAILVILAVVAGAGLGYFLTPSASQPVNSASVQQELELAPDPAITTRVHPDLSSSNFARTADAIGRIASASLGELPGHLDAALDLQGAGRTHESQIMLQALVERWAELDPAGGAVHMFAKNRKSFAQQIFTAWTERAPDEALEAARGWEPESERSDLYAAVIAQIGRSDHERFRALVLEGDPPLPDDLSYGIGQSALGEIAVNDLDAALELLRALPVGSQRSGIIGIAKSLAGMDPTAATRWAIELKNKDHRGAALWRIAVEISQRDPDAAAELLPHFPDSSKFPAEMVARHMIESGRDREATFDWLLEIKSGEAAGKLFVSDLAATDPQVAFANLNRILNSLDKPPHGLIGSSLDVFGTAALPELAAALAPDTNRDLTSAIASHWTRHDPEAALGWLSEFLPNVTNGEMVNRLSRSLQQAVSFSELSGGATQKLADLSSRLGPAQRDRFVRSITQEMAESGDPEVAEFFLNELATSDAQRKRFINMRFSRLADANPQDAIAKMGELTEPLLQNTAAELTAYSWSGYAPFAASSWVASLPEGVQRDHAASGLAGATIHHDPVAALAWLASINDVDVRARSIRDYAGGWRPGSIDDANEVLGDIDFTPEEKSEILTKIESRLAPE
ncbi:MAG: hypothetical protein ACR2RV_04720 [Verrucomicrobiales bacterium]